MKLTKTNLDDIEISPDLAEICGIHAGDGYLRSKGHRRELDISGGVEEKDYYDKHVVPLFNSVFNLDIKPRFFPHRSTYGFVIRNPEIIKFMHKIGFPYGAKSLKVAVPSIILNNDRLKLCQRFLRGYFDIDGHLAFGKKYGKYVESKRTRHCYPRIMFSTVSLNLANNLKVILNKLEFNFVYYSQKPARNTESLKYAFNINGIQSLNRWMDLIGIKNPTKHSRLLVWKKFKFCPTNITHKQRLKIINGQIDPNTFYSGPMV